MAGPEPMGAKDRRRAVATPESIALGPLRVYRSDLDEIIAALRDHKLAISIHASGYEYDSLDDLVEVSAPGRRVSNLVFVGFKGSGLQVVVTLGSSESNVSWSDDRNLELRGAGLTITRLLTKAQIRLFAGLELAMPVVMSGLLVTIGVFALSGNSTLPLPLAAALLLAFMVAALATVIGSTWKRTRHASIYLVAPHEVKDGWLQSDDFKTAAIAAVLGAIAGAAISEIVRAMVAAVVSAGQ